MEGANSAQPNSLAGFYKPLPGGGKREEKGRKGGERKGGKGGKGQDKTPPKISGFGLAPSRYSIMNSTTTTLNYNYHKHVTESVTIVISMVDFDTKQRIHGVT